ncbi:hypothetical protein [Actinacidiphila glaucinigra]|uniref:hypothetical protein n=1 Tax=Actinacidiphila glaucinigra TaxID=235986 RepID=UPI0035E03F32
MSGVPLAEGRRLRMVHRAFEEDAGVDHPPRDPGRESAEPLAADKGHVTGPGLSWAEPAADNGLPGGGTDNPHARPLLLLPASGDDAVPAHAHAEGRVTGGPSGPRPGR